MYEGVLPHRCMGHVTRMNVCRVTQKMGSFVVLECHGLDGTNGCAHLGEMYVYTLILYQDGLACRT